MRPSELQPISFEVLVAQESMPRGPELSGCVLRFVSGKTRCSVEEDPFNVFDLLEAAELRLGAKVVEDQSLPDPPELRECRTESSEIFVERLQSNSV